jgi:hypothetical protein
VRELEETHGVGLSDLALHHLARDLTELEVQPAPPCVLGNGVMQTHLPLPTENIAGFDSVVGHLIHDLLGLVDRDRRVGGANVDHPARLATMELKKPLDTMGWGGFEPPTDGL